MTARIIFLAGVHGVGKSSLANFIKEKFSVNCYSSSCLIKSEKNSPVDSYKRVLDPSENQKYLLKAIDNLDSSEKLIVLDGHFVLLAPDDFFYVPLFLFKSLPVITIVLKILCEKEICDRLMLRDGHAPEVDVIKELQSREIARAKKVSRLLKVNLIMVENENYHNINFNIDFDELQ